MSEKCACPGCLSSRNPAGNSGRIETIRRTIWTGDPDYERITRILGGSVCIKSVRAQMEAAHGQRFTADVLQASLQIAPAQVTDACIDHFLSPLGRMAIVVPGSRPGNAREAMVRITAAIGDVARAVSEDSSSKARIRKETAEAIQALHELMELTEP